MNRRGTPGDRKHPWYPLLGALPDADSTMFHQYVHDEVYNLPSAALQPTLIQWANTAQRLRPNIIAGEPGRQMRDVYDALSGSNTLCARARNAKSAHPGLDESTDKM